MVCFRFIVKTEFGQTADGFQGNMIFLNPIICIYALILKLVQANEQKCIFDF